MKTKKIMKFERYTRNLILMLCQRDGNKAADCFTLLLKVGTIKNCRLAYRKELPLKPKYCCLF